MSAPVTRTGPAAELRDVELPIHGMMCAACSARVEKRLGALKDVTAAVNFATGKAVVTVPVSVPVTRLIEAVEEAGYSAEPTAWPQQPSDPAAPPRSSPPGTTV